MRRTWGAQRLLWGTILVSLPLTLGSCATHRDAVAMRDQMDAFNVRLTEIEQHNAILDTLLEEQRQLTLAQRANLGLQMQTQNEQLSQIAARQDEINVLLHDLLSQLEAIQLYGGVGSRPGAQPSPQGPDSSGTNQAPAPVSQPGSPSSELNAKPQELYQAAMDDVNRGSYALAESRLLTFLIQFPDHELAENAQYWLGESAFGQQKFDVAIQEIDKFLKKYPKSSLIPAALLKKSQAQTQSGETRAAQQTLQQLIKSYPKSKEAADANELLSKQE